MHYCSSSQVFHCVRRTCKKSINQLTPVILAAQEAEIRRIAVQSQPEANSSQDPILKIPN
jgi:hypothetical protein